MSSRFRMIIAGGGTGGHYFPAQTLKESLIKIGVNIKYIGSQYGIESSLLNKNDPDITLLNIRGIQRHLNIKSIMINSLFPFRFLDSYIKSREIISDFKPHIVIGTGGYSSGIPLLAAIHKGIKTIIHEQNSYPGITTKKLMKKVDRVCISFEDVKYYLKGENILHTGNPIRSNINPIDKNQAKQSYDFDINKPVLAILGGSQGATIINQHFKNNLNKYIESNIQILWQCGNKDFENLKKSNKIPNVHIIPFTDSMDMFYSAADLIVSRSGALALSEMALLGKAMVLIPIPSSAGNHQFINAKSFQNINGAIVINQKSLQYGALEKAVLPLIHDLEKIKLMEQNSKKLGQPNATKKIIKIIMDLVNN